ncbi:hypothetical protein MPSEU_000354800 [Mayamaea pseudoterrestris]|nr:hypothetical protein MPSEU_000354800 [Mayamaea pseudoterrestris]
MKVILRPAAACLIVIAIFLVKVSHAWHACDASSSSVCPDGNTCCPTTTDGSFTCVSGHDETKGVCCDAMGVTGCGEGFACAQRRDDNAVGTLPELFCEKVDAENDELPDRVPRYQLCSVASNVLQEIYGLPIAPNIPPLAYLSTMGSLHAADAATLQQHLMVETLLVVIHGSGRNADDYICAAHAATPDPDTTLIVAPWFLAPGSQAAAASSSSSDSSSDSSSEPLYWEDENGPIYHTWRYGADAMNAPVSAYAAVDVLLDYVATSIMQFPKLRNVIVAGHSAGGQYAQRWALLSNCFALTSPLLKLRIVVANPKSFCYLDARRYLQGTLRLPTRDEIGNCTSYNEWEWGLGEGDFLPTPYKNQAIRDAGGVDAVVRRYIQRDVVYLAGELDVLLNGDCQAQLQGPFRRQRSEHFFASIKQVYGHQFHHRLVVANVHHDHALMLQSPEGQEALFGALSGNEYE